jgi:hypothetical protein
MTGSRTRAAVRPLPVFSSKDKADEGLLNRLPTRAFRNYPEGQSGIYPNMDIEVGGYPGFRLGFGYFSGFRGIMYFRLESQSGSCILLSQHEHNTTTL